MKNIYVKFLLALVLVCGGGNVAFAQFLISASGTNYSQDFNTLTAGTWTDNTTLLGWYAKTDATASITSYGANTGSTTTAGLYAFGVAGTNPLADRALGYAPSNGYTGASGTGKGYTGWRLKNNTSSTLTSISVTWSGEQWRRDNATAQNLVLSYQQASSITNLTSGTWITTSSTFVSPQLSATTLALDGNTAVNRTSNITISITVSIPAGEEIMLRWEDLNDAGNDHFLAIDDVTINATAGTPTPTITVSGALTGLNYIVGAGPSASQSFTVAGTNLTADLTVDAPTNFEIATTSTGTYGATLNVTQTAGTVATTTLYTRLKAGLAVNTYTGNINVNSTGATQKTISLTGVVSAVPTPTITPSATSVTGMTYVYGSGPSTATTFTISGSGLTGSPGNITVGGSTNYEVSTTSATTGFGTTATIAFTSGTLASSSVWVRLKISLPVNTYNGETISISGGGASTSVTASGNVTPKALTITGLTGANKIYDATITAGAAGTATLSGVVGGDVVTLGGTPSFSFATKNVGTGKAITVTGYTISGAQAANYTITQPALLTANVTVATLTITGMTANNKPYDATTAATFTGGTLSGVLLSDVVTLNKSGTFATANVGTGIVVTSNSTITGTDATNYTLTQPTGLSADITAAAPTFTTSTIGILVGGTYLLPGANISSNSSGALTYSLGTATPVGSVTLTGTTINGIAIGTAVLTVNQAASGNYLAGSTTVTVNVASYNVGDFRSVSDGNWHSTAASNTATWETYNGSSWVSSAAPATSAGSLGTKTVYIKTQITLVGTNTAPNVVVDSLGILSTSTVTATFGNLLVRGGAIFNRQANGSGVSGNFEVEDNGTVNFYHTNTTSRTTSIWAGTEKFHPNSNFIIKSSQNTSNFLIIEANTDVSEYIGACFGNLIIDLGAGQIQLLPSGFNKTLANNLIFRNTTGNIRISDGNYSFGLLNNLIIENTYGSSLTALTTAGAATINIGGNFIHNGTNVFRLANNTAATVNFNVNGDINVNSGSFDLNLAVGGVSVVNLKGDLAVSSTGLLSATSGTNTTFNFTGLGDGITLLTTQTISIANAATSSNIAFNANSGSYVKLLNQDFALGTNSKFTVNTGATLDFGFNGTTALNILRVASQLGQTFEAQSSSTLKITSPLGITSAASPADYTGNVQIGGTPATRLFDPNATYYYIGKANQVSGAGLPSALSNKVIVELNDDALTFNASGSKTFATGGTLEIRKGIVVDDPSNAFNTSGSQLGNLTMIGGRYRISKTSTQPPFTGSYNLAAGVIEFANSQATAETITGKNAASADIIYNQIEITGNNVRQSNDDIILNATAGKLTVVGAPTPGTFYMSSRSLKSNATTNTSTVIVQNGGTFVTESSKGFSGFATTSFPSNNSSVHSNVNSVVLNDGSTVRYERLDIQDISNQIPYSNLVLAGSGDKTVSSTPSTTLEVKGNLTGANTAVFKHNNGTVLLSGSSAQIYSATAANPFEFYNLTNGGSDVSVNSNMGVVNTLAFNPNSAFKINTGDVYIRSTLAKTGKIDIIPASASITYPSTGRFVVERFINSGGTHGKTWQFLSAPAIGETVLNTWQEGGGAYTPALAGKGTWITSPTGASFDSLSVTPSLKSYNPLLGIWEGKANATDLLDEPRGYMLFVRGDRSVHNLSTPVNVTTLRTRGKIYTDNVGNKPPSWATGTPAGKFISVGNPYASAISLSSFFSKASGIENNFYVWDPSLQGSYYVGGYQTFAGVLGYLATPGGSAIYTAGEHPHIQSSQAFMVKTTSASNSVAFEESIKVSQDSLVTKQGNPADNNIGFNEMTVISTFLTTADGRMADGNRVVFDPNYTDVVNELDAKKFNYGGENLGLMRHGAELVVEARGALSVADTLFYNMRSLASANYKLVFAMQNIANPLNLQGDLIDKYLGTDKPISLTDSSFVNFAVTSAAGSRAADRFMLVFKPAAGPLPVTFVSIAATRNTDRTIAVTWKVENEINLDKYVVERSADGRTFAGILTKDVTNSSAYMQNDLSPLSADNFYRIKAISKDGQVQYSTTVKVAPSQTAASIAVYPNPAVGKTIQVQFTNQATGKYQLLLTNKIGQTLYKGVAQVTGNSYSKGIELNAATVAGVYQLKIIAADGKVTTQQVVVE